MGDCSPHRIIMAENQEMSPIEMKVARQIEVILILKLKDLHLVKLTSVQLFKSFHLTSSTTLGITIFRETSFSKNNCNLMMAG